MSTSPPGIEEQALEEIKTHARIALIGKMSGVRSNAKNLKHEDARVWQSINDDRRRLEGLPPLEDGDVRPKCLDDLDDEMDIMAGGDVTIFVGEPPKTDTQVPPPPPPIDNGNTPPVEKPSGIVKDTVVPIVKKVGMSFLKKLVIAGVAGSGIGLPAVAAYFLTRPKPTPPANVQPAQPSFGIGLLPPGPNP